MAIDPRLGQSSVTRWSVRCVWLGLVFVGSTSCSSKPATHDMPLGTQGGNTHTSDAATHPGSDPNTPHATGGAGTSGTSAGSVGATSSGASGTHGTSTSGASGSVPVADASAPDASTGVSDSGDPDASSPTAMSYPPLDPAAIGMPAKIADGFSLAESPLWDPCGDRLLFADVSATGGGKINAVDANGTVTEFMSNTGNTNGMAWDIDGSLILAQMTGHVARRDRAGMVTQIDPPMSNLHTPDDVTVRSDGTIYLSDGDFCPIGTLLGYSSALPVFTIKPNTTTLINSGTVRGPNGIELSPDEKVLYVSGYGEGSIYRFDVMPDGMIMKQPQALITGLSDSDSMCLDAAGNLYVAVRSGIQVLSPEGDKIKLIPVTAPAGSCTKAGMTNCTFGGKDGKTLYITSWTTLFKIDDMPIPGLEWFIGQKRAKCM
jgi:gluconolactonase